MRSSLLARRSTLVRSAIYIQRVEQGRRSRTESNHLTGHRFHKRNIPRRRFLIAKGSSPQTMETTTATEATLGEIILKLFYAMTHSVV